MNFIGIIEKTISNQEIIGAISSTLLIIMVGYFFRTKGIFNDRVAKVMSDIAMQVALPCLAFNAFMQDINQDSMRQGINLLIWGFVVYILLILISKLFFLKYDKSKEDMFRVLSVFGSTTFYGTPICGAIYGSVGIMYASIFNIGYRAFLYSYGYIKMSGLKLEKKNFKQMFLNPVLIATILGMLVWAFQQIMPQMVGFNPYTKQTISYGILRIDKTAYWLYKPMQYLAGISSPLAWLSIGATLGSISLKEATKNKDSWYYTFIKVIIIPLINIVFVLILNYTGILTFDGVGLGVIVIMTATPAATVTAAYAISFDKEALLASNATLISTVIAVLLTPFWIVIIEVLAKLPLFN